MLCKIVHKDTFWGKYTLRIISFMLLPSIESIINKVAIGRAKIAVIIMFVVKDYTIPILFDVKSVL